MPTKLNELGDWLEELRIEWKVPGLAVAVLQEGQLSYLQGFGLRDIGKELPVTPNTRFSIASTTKAFTTMAMAMLVDEGKLDWDEPIRSYIPSFNLWDTFATHRITPRDLVTHRSGLPRHDNLWRFSSYNRAELFQRLQYLEPSYDMRSVYQYNNLMYMAAGYLVEHLSGMSWEEFVMSRIVEPLGMSSTGPGPVQVPGYTDFSLPHSEINGEVTNIPFFSKSSIGPAGSIISTASDMTRWLQLHLNGGQYEGKVLVSKENLVQMHSPQMLIRGRGQLTAGEQLEKFDEIGFGSYGLGWRINAYRGYTLVHHSGAIDGFSGLVSLMPQEGTGVIVFTNFHNSPLPYIISLGIYDRLLGLELIPWNQRVKMLQEHIQASQEDQPSWEEKRITDTKPSHSLEDYVGTYEHPAYGTIMISVEEEKLVVKYGGYTLPLAHHHYDIFYLTVELENDFMPVSFIGDLQGKISRLSIPLEPAVSDIVFIRQATR